jgi:hypothetical protein
LVVVFYIGVVVMDAWPPDPLPYRLGQYIPNDISARVSFKVPSQRLLSEAMDNARNTTPVTFRLNKTLVDEIIASLEGNVASWDYQAAFTYNENKQAHIANADAGTYAQLIEAAESCQVAIIHPGKPRNADEPGLEELMKRAEAFR